MVVLIDVGRLRHLIEDRDERQPQPALGSYLLNRDVFGAITKKSQSPVERGKTGRGDGGWNRECHSTRTTLCRIKTPTRTRLFTKVSLLLG